MHGGGAWENFFLTTQKYQQTTFSPFRGFPQGNWNQQLFDIADPAAPISSNQQQITAGSPLPLLFGNKPHNTLQPHF
jgi:hypothetical protein